MLEVLNLDNLDTNMVLMYLFAVSPSGELTVDFIFSVEHNFCGKFQMYVTLNHQKQLIIARFLLY